MVYGERFCSYLGQMSWNLATWLAWMNMATNITRTRCIFLVGVDGCIIATRSSAGIMMLVKYLQIGIVGCTTWLTTHQRWRTCRDASGWCLTQRTWLPQTNSMFHIRQHGQKSRHGSRHKHNHRQPAEMSCVNTWHWCWEKHGMVHPRSYVNWLSVLVYCKYIKDKRPWYVTIDTISKYLHFVLTQKPTPLNPLCRKQPDFRVFSRLWLVDCV